MRAASLLCAIAASILAACHPTHPLALPPFEPDSASMLLIVVRNSVLSSVWATDLEEPTFPPLFDDGRVELYAVEFCCPLDVLGLQPGGQRLAVTAKQRPVLPPPNAIHTSEIDGASQSAWEPDSPALVNDVIQKLELPENNLCKLYTVEFAVHDATGRGTATSSTPSFGIPLGDGRVFVGALGGEFYVVSEENGGNNPTIPWTALSTTTPHHGAFRRDDGEIFLLGNDGSFARGDLERGMTIQSERALGGAGDSVRMAGAKDGPIELFAVTDARSFQKFDGVRWTTISTAARDFEPGELLTFLRPSITYLGRDEVLVSRSGMRTNRVQHYRAGVITDESPLGRETVAELYNFPTVGVVAGGRSGGLNFRNPESSSWGERINAVVGQVRAMAPIGPHGLLIFSVSDNALLPALTQFHPAAGGCPYDQNVTSGYVREMVPIGERSTLLLISNPLTTNPGTQMTILEQISSIDECLERSAER